MGKEMKNIVYWSLVIFVLILQFIFTINSTHQILYEEFADSIRNVYWLQNHTIYDGASINVGWYGILLAIYNIFGFSFNSAKYFRLALQVISLFSLAYVLRKYLGFNKAWFLFLTISLSPIWIYFNSLQAANGIDLQYIPICIFLIVTLNFRNKVLFYAEQIFLWILIMIGWLSYPNFIYYIPSLTLLYAFMLHKQIKSNYWSSYVKYFALNVASFILPLIATFLYLKDKQLFIYDSIVKSGMFRGGGSFILDYGILLKNLSGFFKDLIFKVDSYSFELSKSDFSDYYPLIALLLVFAITIVAYAKDKKLRLPIFTSVLIIVFTIMVSSLTLDPSGNPGIRRYLKLLVGTYSLVGITWYYINSIKFKYDVLKILFLGIYSLLLIHNLFAYPNNLWTLKEKPSKYSYNVGSSTKDYVNLAIETITKEDLYLNCKNTKGEFTDCRYSEIFAAVAGACEWNNLQCKSIYGYDIKTQKYISLSVKLWEEYYLEH